MSAKVQLIISSLIAHIGAALKNQIARRRALVPADEWLLSPIYWAESGSAPSLGLRRREAKKHMGECYGRAQITLRLLKKKNCVG